MSSSSATIDVITDAASTLGRKRWEGKSQNAKNSFSRRGLAVRWAEQRDKERLTELERKIELTKDRIVKVGR